MLYNSPVAPVTFLQIVIGLIPSPRAPQSIQMGIVVKLGMTMAGFIKYMRSEAALSLLSKPLANHLLSVIASRARYHSDPINGLDVGQCFMGDFTTIGLTRQQYRSNLHLLEKAGIVTTRTTNKGTIVTLINTDIYDINSDEQPSSQPTDNHQATIKQPSNNHPTTTNKERKKERREEGKKEIQVVFDHWVSVMNKPRASFTKNRKAAVTRILKEGYTVDDIKQAIDGCAHSAYHMGQNDRGTIYDDLELICRNGSKLENFRDNLGKAIVETKQERNIRVIQETPLS